MYFIKITIIFFNVGTKFVVSGNMFCWPSKAFLDYSWRLPLVKEQCIKDSSCAMFYKGGKSANYYMCDKTANRKISSAESTLYSKGNIRKHAL